MAQNEGFTSSIADFVNEPKLKTIDIDKHIHTSLLASINNSPMNWNKEPMRRLTFKCCVSIFKEAFPSEMEAIAVSTSYSCSLEQLIVAVNALKRPSHVKCFQ